MISIKAKMRPFSHREGTQCVLPGTDLILEASPHRLRVGLWEISLDGEPFERPFTVQQDLEKQCVKVFGSQFAVQLKAAPQGFIFQDLRTKEEVAVPLHKHFDKRDGFERLSLGSHKLQDWDLVLRRMDLKEILPVIYALSQTIADRSEFSFVAPMTEKELLQWVSTSFHQMLVPKVAGEIWQEAFSNIRSLFIREEDQTLTLLPMKLFPEGRFLDVKTAFGTIDFEWAKWRLRRAALHVEKEGEIYLPQFVSCRVRHFLHERGEIHTCSKPLVVHAGQKIFLDRFFV